MLVFVSKVIHLKRFNQSGRYVKNFTFSCKLDLVTYLFTYLRTPWSRVLLEKLPDLQLVTKFPTFHGTRRFITAVTSARQLSLYWASPIQSIYPQPTSWRSIRILSIHLRLGLPSGLFPSGLLTKTHYSDTSVNEDNSFRNHIR